MGSIGDCYVNARIESFWGRLQTELLNRQRWKTRIELVNALFEYLEIFHNRRRRHSALGMLTPIEYFTCSQTVNGQVDLGTDSPTSFAPGRLRP